MDSLSDKNNNENLVLLATMIALELSKGKTPSELHDLKILIGHLYSTICVLLTG